MQTKISIYKPKIRLGGSESFKTVGKLIDAKGLHTICESGKCPNKAECWGRGTATFMILGNTCTRSCKFCGVATGKPNVPDVEEPRKVAESVKAMNLKHVVLTSVTRDDLSDGGAEIWARTVEEVRSFNPGITIETLIPDFKANENALNKLIDVKPDIISHNLETVRRLTKTVRIQAQYERSLTVLNYLQSSGIRTKSGIMVGVGELKGEVFDLMDDLLSAECKILTIGQYLPPSKKHLTLVEYVPIETFLEYREVALSKGFEFVESSPLVRSSYMAENHIVKK